MTPTTSRTPAADAPDSRVPVLEWGGTHASARWVARDGWAAGTEIGHAGLAGGAGADAILDALAGCAGAFGPLAGRLLAAAAPGPFDYENGIARYQGVGKYEALAGLDVGASLAARLESRPRRIVFVNDADAFGVGEWLARRRPERLIGITLGTGVGSAFVAHGRPMSWGVDVPPGGELHRTTIAGSPLEETVSRRAILAGYRAAGGSPEHDVREIAALGGSGDRRALAAFVAPITGLGRALRPWVARFRPRAVVVGGSMSRSWSLVGPALREGLGDVGAGVEVVRSDDPDARTAAGAAYLADRRGQ